MPSRNKNFIILPKSWSGHGRTDRTGSAGPVQWPCGKMFLARCVLSTPLSCHFRLFVFSLKNVLLNLDRPFALSTLCKVHNFIEKTDFQIFHWLTLQ